MSKDNKVFRFFFYNIGVFFWVIFSNFFSVFFLFLDCIFDGVFKGIMIGESVFVCFRYIFEGLKLKCI